MGKIENAFDNATDGVRNAVSKGYALFCSLSILPSFAAYFLIDCMSVRK